MRTIYFFNNCFPSEEYPTQGTYAQTIANAISDAGYNVRYVVLYRKKNKLWDYFKFYMYLFHLNFPRKREILYVNHYTTLLPLILRLLFERKDAIFHWHGEELLRENIGYRFLRFLMKKTFTDSTIHISPSNYYKSIIINKLNVLPEKIVISPSGGLDFRNLNERLLPIIDEIHIGFPAALNEHKGIKYLKMVIDNLFYLEKKLKKKVYIHVIRYGDKSSDFIKEIKNAVSERIVVREKYSHECIQHFYQDIHLSLFFSKRESLGLTVLESMACGVPVIARSNTSLPELIIPGKSGELVPNQPTYDEIENEIVKVISNISSYRPRDKAVEYSYENVVLQYKSLFKLFDN